MSKRSIRNGLLFFFCLILVLLSVSAEASIYKDYESKVITLAKCIRTELSFGGGELIKGVSITSSDKKEWEKAEKILRRGLYGDDYDYIFSKRFNTDMAAYGYFDTLVGMKYRYLELLNKAVSKETPYYLFAEATELNKYYLDYYINNKSSMYTKLDSIYKKEIAPYKKKNIQTRLAIIVTCVANYFTYSNKDLTNNLAYTIKKKKGVCADYAYMTDYFMRKMGLTTRLVSLRQKFSKDDDWGWHLINAVKINGGWFYLDPTNMDYGKYAIYRDGGNKYFSAELDDLSFPGWKVRSVY